jgi:hypothetical protein
MADTTYAVVLSRRHLACEHERGGDLTDRLASSAYVPVAKQPHVRQPYDDLRGWGLRHHARAGICSADWQRP